MVKITLTEQMMYRIGFDVASNSAEYLETYGESYETVDVYVPIDFSRIIAVSCNMIDPTNTIKCGVNQWNDESDDKIENEPRLKEIIIECLNKVV